MRLRSRSGWLLLTALTVLGPAPSAQAWTRTVVKGAHATVDIERDGTLIVLLRLEVDVLAGWLQELELADLGEDVELNLYQPPYFRSEEGKVRRPEVEVTEDGRVRLSFRWRDAPKRGEHRVYIRYRAKADVSATEVGERRKARVVWSIPAWETSLYGVRVDFRAPKGSTVPANVHEALPGVRYEVRAHTTRTFVQWYRNHLPRMTAWPLAIDVPADSMAVGADEPEDAPRPAGFQPLERSDEMPLAWPLLFLVVLFLWKRRSLEARMGARALCVRAPWPVLLVGAGGLLAVGQWLLPNPLVCVAPLLLLVLHRPARPAPPPECRAWRPGVFDELPKRKIRAHDFFDITTRTGLLTLAACGVGLLVLGHPTAAVLTLPVFLIGTRLHVAPTAAEIAHGLAAFAAELRIPEVAPEMAFSWELSSDGLPRLAIVLPGHRVGLLGLSFVVATCTVGLVRRRKVMLLVETRTQSDADDLVRRRTRTEPDFRFLDGRNLRLVAWDGEAIELLRTLARKTPKPVKTSRGTWLLREISEPAQRAA